MAQQAGPGHPKYMAIAGDLRGKIESGEYPPGSQLPTHAVLMETYGVALNTARDALGELRRLGLVETFQGSGTFVLAPRDGETAGQDGERRDIRALSEQVAEMTEALGRIEGNLIELYGKTGNEYPWEELHGDAGEKGGSREQRA